MVLSSISFLTLIFTQPVKCLTNWQEVHYSNTRNVKKVETAVSDKNQIMCAPKTTFLAQNDVTFFLFLFDFVGTLMDECQANANWSSYETKQGQKFKKQIPLHSLQDFAREKSKQILFDDALTTGQRFRLATNSILLNTCPFIVRPAFVRNGVRIFL